MANTSVAWIDELLFDKNKFDMEDTFSSFVHTASNYKTKKYSDNEYKIVVHKGGHHLKKSYIWEQLNKQFEALEHNLGIKVEFYENKNERYWRLVLDTRNLDGLPDFIKLVKKLDNCYKIKVINARRYIKACNRALKEYLYWCMLEHKNYAKVFIIPNVQREENKFYGFKFKVTELDKKRT